MGRSRRHPPKIRTFDGSGFWSGAYAHQRGNLLRRAGVPDDQIAGLANRKYGELPAALRYEIETCGADKRDLL